jgi:hypothetical protein
MKKSKFADIAKTFTNEEIKEFGKYLNSPFFNSNKNLSSAFEFIGSHTRGFTSDFPTKEELHIHVYGDKKYTDENIRYLLSELLRMAEEFLGQVNIKKSKTALRIHTLKELNERDKEKLFERNLKLCRKDLGEMNINDYGYHLDEFHLINEERGFKSKREEFISDPGGRTEAMIKFYAIETLNECRFYYNQNVRSNEKESYIPMEKELLDYVKKNDFLGLPIVEILYNQVMSILDFDNTEYFYSLKELSERHAGEISKVEKYNTFVMLLNYANKRLAFGEREFADERLEIHKMADKSNAITKDNYIAPLRFERIVDDALAVSGFDWAEEFISNYKEKLPENDRDSIINLSYANISYLKGDKEKALDHILNANFEPVVLNLRKRNFTLKLYYELNYLETFVSYIDSYKHYLSKNQKEMPPDVFEHYSAFLRAALDLGELKSLYKKDIEDRIMVRLESLRPGKELHWISENVKVLSQRKK